MIATQIDWMSPVHDTPEDAASQPEQRVARCLCGGGYRAMAVHVGVLWRHNEVGLLPKLDRVFAVSGGSITSCVLATNWADLKLDGETGVATNLIRQVGATGAPDEFHGRGHQGGAYRGAALGRFGLRPGRRGVSQPPFRRHQPPRSPGHASLRLQRLIWNPLCYFGSASPTSATAALAGS